MKEKFKNFDIKKINIWKWLFFIILALNIIFFASIAYKIHAGTKNVPTEEVRKPKNLEGADSIARIEMTSEQVNRVSNDYLEAYQSDKLKYKFSVSDKAVLEANYKFMFFTVPLKVIFMPYAMDNGEVQLKIESISAGNFNLDKGTVLKYIKGAYKFPDFVSIDSSKEIVTIVVPDIELPNNMFAEADQIDLAKGKFAFNLLEK